MFDRDLPECPISYQVFQHPVLASDGRNYELSELLQVFTTFNHLLSPLTNELITHVTYNLELKNQLDESVERYSKQEDIENQNVALVRYPSYAKEPVLAELNQFITAHLPRGHVGEAYCQPPLFLLLLVKAAAVGALTTITIAWAYHLAMHGAESSSEHIKQDDEDTNARLIGLAIGGLDMGIRYFSNYRHTLFGTLGNLASRAMPESVSIQIRQGIASLNR